MDDEFTFRWIEPDASDEEWLLITAIIANRGWMKLNSKTSRALVAECDGVLAAFVILQMVPHTEPLWVAPEFRGTGLAENMSTRIINFMLKSNARGWIAIATNNIVATACERQSMKLVQSPVYAYVKED